MPSNSLTSDAVLDALLESFRDSDTTFTGYGFRIVGQIRGDRVLDVRRHGRSVTFAFTREGLIQALTFAGLDVESAEVRGRG